MFGSLAQGDGDELSPVGVGQALAAEEPDPRPTLSREACIRIIPNPFDQSFRYMNASVIPLYYRARHFATDCTGRILQVRERFVVEEASWTSLSYRPPYVRRSAEPGPGIASHWCLLAPGEVHYVGNSGIFRNGLSDSGSGSSSSRRRGRGRRGRRDPDDDLLIATPPQGGATTPIEQRTSCCGGSVAGLTKNSYDELFGPDESARRDRTCHNPADLNTHTIEIPVVAAATVSRTFVRGSSEARHSGALAYLFDCLWPFGEGVPPKVELVEGEEEDVAPRVNLPMDVQLRLFTRSCHDGSTVVLNLLGPVIIPLNRRGWSPLELAFGATRNQEQFAERFLKMVDELPNALALRKAYGSLAPGVFLQLVRSETQQYTKVKLLQILIAQFFASGGDELIRKRVISQLEPGAETETFFELAAHLSRPDLMRGLVVSDECKQKLLCRSFRTQKQELATVIVQSCFQDSAAIATAVPVDIVGEEYASALDCKCQTPLCLCFHSGMVQPLSTMLDSISVAQRLELGLDVAKCLFEKSSDVLSQRGEKGAAMVRVLFQKCGQAGMVRRFKVLGRDITQWYRKKRYLADWIDIDEDDL